MTDVSVGALAVRHRVTPRTIQTLFENEGTTLTGFVLQQRLARAHRLLCDPLKTDEKIAGIALDAGFGDLSYFNQAFRRRYGAAPSDVRAQARLRIDPMQAAAALHDRNAKGRPHAAAPWT